MAQAYRLVATEFVSSPAFTYRSTLASNVFVFYFLHMELPRHNNNLQTKKQIFFLLAQ